VLNGCRTVLRKRSRRLLPAYREPDAESAEALALLGEEHREVLAALRRLPARQREAVVLRHCLGLQEDEVAKAMNIRPAPNITLARTHPSHGARPHGRRPRLLRRRPARPDQRRRP
jgi:hypothetical protein